MDLRRVPFQFVSSDPAARRAELMRKFGLPSDHKMFIDPESSADPKWRKSSVGASGSTPCSPRLQHRIPCFNNDGCVPIPVYREQSNHSNKSSEFLNSDLSTGNSQKAPNVRIIPIKLENSRSVVNPKSPPNVPEAHPPIKMKSNTSEFPIDNSRFRHSSESSVTGKSGAKPKVCNIPISVEEKTALSKDVITDDTKTLSKRNNGAGCGKFHNGGSASKSPKKANTDMYNVPLKQISDVLSELGILKSSVNNFNGSAKDKQYIYLDEMLTRCMLKLDDVNTMGDEKIRASRKAAVREVQSCVNILDSKVQTIHPDTLEQAGDNTAMMKPIEKDGNSEKMETGEEAGNSEMVETAEQAGNSEVLETVEQAENSEMVETVEQGGNSEMVETVEQAGNSEMVGTVEQPGNSEVLKDISPVATKESEIEKTSQLFVKPGDFEESKIVETVVAQEIKSNGNRVEGCADKEKMSSECVCSENLELEPNSNAANGDQCC